MKKKAKYLFSFLFCLSICSVCTFAYYCETSERLSPVYVLDVSTNSLQDKLVSEDSTLRCGEVFATFTHGYLPDYCLQEPHDFPIKLMDYDPANTDDFIKRYEGMFEGGVMTYVDYIGLGDYKSSAPIDTEGDDIGEMYLNGILRSLSEAEVASANGRGESMFYYILYSN